MYWMALRSRVSSSLMRICPEIGSKWPVTNSSGCRSRTRSTDAMAVSASRYRSPRMVTRLGMCPKSGPKVFPHRQIRSSGSHITSESLVSPPGTEINSMRRPPTSSVSVSSKSRSTAGTLWPGRRLVPRRRWMAWIPVAKVSLKANALRLARYGIRRSLSSRHNVQFACATTVVSGSRTLSRPPTWSTWPWVKMM